MLTPGTIQILILEDNFSDAELVKLELRRAGFDFTAQLAPNEAEFVKSLEESTPDLILADYSLPGFDGLTAMTLARRRVPDIPVIIVSGAIGEETAIEALKAGATDYVLKQRLSRLGPVVQRALRESEELADRKRAEQELVRARYDTEQRTAQLESFISSMADGAALFDADGNSLFVNETGFAMFDCPPGWDFGDCVSQSQWYVLEGTPRPLPAQETAMLLPLRGEVIKDARYRVISPFGKEAMISVSASPVRDSQGKITGAVNVFRDVTDRVGFERAKRELYNREHHIAEMLQQTVVPTVIPRQLRGVSIAARYQPALQEAQVGGDFYDVFELGDDCVGVLIGDVVGKGLQAAIHVAQVRYAVRSYAYLEPNPGKVLTRVNDVVTQEAGDADNVLTAFFAIIDTASRVMTYACAGHEPPIVQTAGNGIDELVVTGPMIGICRGAVYAGRTYELGVGDTVVMFTDGITEARRGGSLLFHKAGVIEHLKQVHGADLEEIAQGLLRAATTHADGSLQDDAAIVVFRCFGI